MFKEIDIQNFKCLNNEHFDLENLNIFTGPNSVGKSSVIQSILLFCNGTLLDGMPFDSISNKYENAKEIDIKIDDTICKITKDAFDIPQKFSKPKKDEDLFYLSESRIGPESLARISNTSRIGDNGEFVIDLFDKNKSKPINLLLVKNDVGSQTLSQNVDYWLSKIFDFDIELKTEKVNENTIKNYYKFNGLENISPNFLGAGISYLAKILIICLNAKPEQIVIIENPEIHLHPKAQSKLGEFFAFIASKGIQLFIETHCEHLINRIRYEVYKKNINKEHVKIFYKETVIDSFIHLTLDNRGKYLNESGHLTKFPSGFFDATLNELLEIG